LRLDLRQRERGHDHVGERAGAPGDQAGVERPEGAGGRKADRDADGRADDEARAAAHR
jgi:hypothetical protein